ncbi:MAG: hypothetical protein JNL54_11600 [Kineosporiaceae bacterium]|nr:hypothetical protein [Kineosporiaceae bacterium]
MRKSTTGQVLRAAGGWAAAAALATTLAACGSSGDVTVTPQGSAGTCIQAGDASVCAGPDGAVAAGGGAVASVGADGAKAVAGGAGASVQADAGSGASGGADGASGGVSVSVDGSGVSVGGAGVGTGGADAKVTTSGALTLDATVGTASCTTVSTVKQITVALPSSTKLELALTGASIGEVTLSRGSDTFAATWVTAAPGTVTVQDSSVTIAGLRLAGDAGEVVLNAEIGC